MSAIDRFKELKAEVDRAQQFVTRHNDGRAQKVVSLDITVKGTGGDVRIPKALKSAVELAAAGRTTAIVSAAMTFLEAELAKAAQDAKTEYAELAQAAGIQL